MLAPSASRGLLSHSGPSTPRTCRRKLLMNPCSLISIQWIEMKAGIADITQGSMKTTSSALIQRRRRMKNPDSSSARTIFTFTASPTKISVLTSVLV